VEAAACGDQGQDRHDWQTVMLRSDPRFPTHPARVLASNLAGTCLQLLTPDHGTNLATGAHETVAAQAHLHVLTHSLFHSLQSPELHSYPH
jgi:hypothetical protein